MKKVFLGIFLSGVVLTSCGDKNKEAETELVSNEGTEAHSETVDNTADAPAAEDKRATEMGAKPKSGEIKLNPPHGEPGHRCEIPVGAPLDSNPAQNTQTAVPAQQGGQAPNGQGFLSSGNNANQQPAAQPQAQPQQVAQQTAPGMKGKPNPAHGEPGHRCDIQVGQPLP